MGTHRHYVRLRPDALADLLSRPDGAMAALRSLFAEQLAAGLVAEPPDPPGEASVYDISKGYELLDVVLQAAGIPDDEALGTAHVVPFDPAGDPGWPWYDEFERRLASPPTYLLPEAVRAVAARLAAADFEAAFEDVADVLAEEVVMGPAELFRDEALELCRSVAAWYAAAATRGDAVVAVLR